MIIVDMQVRSDNWHVIIFNHGVVISRPFWAINGHRIKVAPWFSTQGVRTLFRRGYVVVLQTSLESMIIKQSFAAFIIAIIGCCTFTKNSEFLCLL